MRIHLGLEKDLNLDEEEMEENKLTIKKVMDINKCVAAFLAEQEPNEKQVGKLIAEQEPNEKQHFWPNKNPMKNNLGNLLGSLKGNNDKYL